MKGNFNVGYNKKSTKLQNFLGSSNGGAALANRLYFLTNELH
jgi:hypothetical protein